MNARSGSDFLSHTQCADRNIFSFVCVTASMAVAKEDRALWFFPAVQRIL
jgi:hypothetical protein